MVIKVKDIPLQGLDVDFLMEPKQFTFTSLPARPGDGKLAGPVAVRLRATKYGRNVLLSGQIACQVSLVCSRCLKDFRRDIGLDIKKTLFPYPGRLPGEEREPALEDLDADFYRGDEIDLAPLVEEDLLLSLPFRALCQEDCLGLCPSCGADLNLGACRCPPAVMEEKETGGENA